MVRRLSFGLVLALALIVIPAVSPSPAQAVIHEIVAAYCSGGDVGTITATGELEPPGIADPSKKNFAAPVAHNGSVDLTTFTATDKPNAKFPEGTSVFDAVVAVADHPSAEHCAKAQ